MPSATSPNNYIRSSIMHLLNSALQLNPMRLTVSSGGTYE